MKLFSLFIALMLNAAILPGLLAQECFVAGEKIVVNWKAFKTPKKVGVSGSFDDVVMRLENNNTAAPMAQILHGRTVTINTQSVNSGNPERDAKLVNAFFKMMSGDQITAKILKADENTIKVSIMLNGKTREVSMDYHYAQETNTTVANGTIDLLDFAADGPLASINKACYDLHEGKTWSDVVIGFELPVSAVACPGKKEEKLSEEPDIIPHSI